MPSVGQAVLASAAACYSGGVDWTFQHRVVKTLGDDSYVPDGVVNDRWQTDSLFRRVMGLRPARGSFDLFLKRVTARDPGVVDTITPPAVPHADFTTREYAQYEASQDFVWETTRGMGTSYGYTPPPSRCRSGRSGDEASRVATGGQAGSSNRCGP